MIALVSPLTIRPGTGSVRVFTRTVRVDKVTRKSGKIIFTEYGREPLVINTAQVRQVELIN